MFDNDKIKYLISFEISERSMVHNAYGFEAQEINKEVYTCKIAYDTKNEAIDAMIAQLQALKT